MHCFSPQQLASSESSCELQGVYLFDLLLNDVHFSDEASHSLVNRIVRPNDFAEDVKVLSNAFHALRVVVLGVDELPLCSEGGVLLLEVSVPGFLRCLQLSAFVQLLGKVIDDFLFLLNLLPQLGQLRILLCHSSSVLVQSLLLEAEDLFCFHLA